VITWNLPDYSKVSNLMASHLLAGVDPDPSPDALGGAELDDPVRPPCDRYFPDHQFSKDGILRVVKRQKKRNADTPVNLRGHSSVV